MNYYLRIIICISVNFLVISSITPVLAQQKKGSDSSSRTLPQTIEALNRIKVKARETDIPTTVSPLLTELKQQLLAVVSETLNEEAGRGRKPGDMQSAIIAKLKAVGITLSEKDNDTEDKPEYSYNEIQDIAVYRPAHHENLLVVTTTFWVMCGRDTSFYLFQKKEGRWNLLLAEEANGYKEIAGAHSWFGYALSPPDANGLFYIVTANVNPWCTSNWQMLRYTVYRPGQSPFNPKILLQKNETIYLGIDPPVYKIETETTNFQLAFNGDWFATPDTGASPQYVRYRLENDKIIEVERGRLK